MENPIPPDLAAMPTGPELAALLAPLDPNDADDAQVLELLTAEVRQLNYQQARVWRVMADIGRRDPMPNLPDGARWTPWQIFDSAVDEIRAELWLTRRSAERELENAEAVNAVPSVARALSDGTIDRTRALVLADGCRDLTDEQTIVLLNELLPKAARSTATQLAERVRKLAVALDPGWAERRYKQAVREQRVIGYLNEDGSATVSGQHLPAEQAAAACARVDALAAAAKRAGAVARIHQLRAQLFLGLLDGRLHGMSETEIVAELQQQFPPSMQNAQTPAAKNPATQQGLEVRVGLGTLLGHDDQPGEIAGWGPVPASVARTVVGRQRKTEWRFAILATDGHLLFDGVTRRRPKFISAAATQLRGGSVELHVPLALLSDPDVAAAFPEWAGLLGDLARQYEEQRPIEQDPNARFAGRPLRRRMQIVFQRCTFAGCRRPASQCDLDHQHEHARGGRTNEINLRPRCKHDHRLKTTGGWRVVNRDNAIVWISPLGRRHVVELEPIAHPLPPPMPRPLPLLDVDIGDDDWSANRPTFEPLDRRGRPITPPY